MNFMQLKRPLIIVTASVLAGLLLFVGGYYFVLFASWDYDVHFIQADACLDYGGVWNTDQVRCWLPGQCEDEGGFWYPAEARCVTDNTTVPLN